MNIESLTKVSEDKTDTNQPRFRVITKEKCESGSSIMLKLVKLFHSDTLSRTKDGEKVFIYPFPMLERGINHGISFTIPSTDKIPSLPKNFYPDYLDLSKEEKALEYVYQYCMMNGVECCTDENSEIVEYGRNLIGYVHSFLKGDYNVVLCMPLPEKFGSDIGVFYYKYHNGLLEAA